MLHHALRKGVHMRLDDGVPTRRAMQHCQLRQLEQRYLRAALRRSLGERPMRLDEFR